MQKREPESRTQDRQAADFYKIIVTLYMYRDSKILALLLGFIVHSYTLFFFAMKVPKARMHTRRL